MYNRYFLRQCIAAFACFMESIACGVVMAFTGTLFPQLELNGSHFVLDKEEETWIASSAILAMSFGCILGGFVLEHLPRKCIIIATNITMIIGFLCIYYSQGVNLLLCGRVICGLAMGMSRPALITIVAEVARPNLRNIFTNLIMLGHVFGALVSDLTAIFSTWRTNALVTCLYPSLTVLIFTYLPETYGSHVGKRNFLTATTNFHWYRGYDTASQEEITKTISNARNNAENETKYFVNITSINRNFFKAFFICATFFAAGQLNGINVLSLYSVQIFSKMFKDVNADYITIGYDSVKIVASLTSMWAIKRYKLRFLTFLSAGGVVLCLVALSVLSYLNINVTDGLEVGRIDILTSIVLILYVQFILCGLAPLPWVTPPELFENDVRGVGSGVTIFLNYIFYFLVVKFSPVLLSFSYVLTFGVFAAITAVLAGILWFILPETKGKTLLDAQATIN